MFFIHGKQEAGEHDDNHRHSRKVCPCAAFEQKETAAVRLRRAAAKQTICRFVRLKATFVLTLDRSLGTGTYAKKIPPFCP